jgi:hypothetical protein
VPFWIGPELVEPSRLGASVPATVDRVLAEMAIEHMVRVNRPGFDLTRCRSCRCRGPGTPAQPRRDAQLFQSQGAGSQIPNIQRQKGGKVAGQGLRSPLKTRIDRERDSAAARLACRQSEATINKREAPEPVGDAGKPGVSVQTEQSHIYRNLRSPHAEAALILNFVHWDYQEHPLPRRLPFPRFLGQRGSFELTDR